MIQKKVATKRIATGSRIYVDSQHHEWALTCSESSSHISHYTLG